MSSDDTRAEETSKYAEPRGGSVDVGPNIELAIGKLSESIGAALAAGAVDLASTLARQVDRLTEELRARRLADAGVASLDDARGKRGAK